MTAQVLTNAQRFGEYKNCDLSTLEYDMMFIRSRIDRRYLGNEAKLIQSKWFDYRFMHAVEATYLFASYYTKATQHWTERVVNMDIAPYVKGFKGGDFLNISSREKVGFWRARIHADSMGINYEFYNNFAFKWLVESNIWKRFPRPNQLYSKPLLEAMVAAWIEECDTVMPLPIDERYRTDTAFECEHTEHFQHWLCNQVAEKTHPEYALDTYMNTYPYLSRDVATKYLGEELVSKVC